MEQVKSVKYLEVVIDNMLPWKNRIKYINHKTDRGIGIIKNQDIIYKKKLYNETLQETFTMP